MIITIYYTRAKNEGLKFLQSKNVFPLMPLIMKFELSYMTKKSDFLFQHYQDNLFIFLNVYDLNIWEVFESYLVGPNICWLV